MPPAGSQIAGPRRGSRRPRILAIPVGESRPAGILRRMELRHHYGDRLHVLDEPTLSTLLARLGAPATDGAEMPELVRAAYRRLTHAALDHHFPVEKCRVPTRMASAEPRAVYDGLRLSQSARLVVCAVIRAGILPAQVCYEAACQVLPSANVRLDFVNMSRVTDSSGHVTGVRLDGSKLGGDVADAVVLIPDPMGATGSTIQNVVEVYRRLSGGSPRAVVAMHLMVTPEATQRVLQACPEVTIHACRFDRGLSPVDVLMTAPGTHPEKERGLDDRHYIVPGAGGMGELLTNSWV